MKTIEEMLLNLARPDVSEFGLVSNKLPSVKVGGKFKAVDTKAPTTEAILGMLIALGGSRYVERLSPKATQWTARVENVGVVSIAAIQRDDMVQVRFVVVKRAGPADAPKPAEPKADGNGLRKLTSLTEMDDADDEPTVQTYAPRPPGPARKPSRADLRIEGLEEAPPMSAAAPVAANPDEISIDLGASIELAEASEGILPPMFEMQSNYGLVEPSGLEVDGPRPGEGRPAGHRARHTPRDMVGVTTGAAQARGADGVGSAPGTAHSGVPAPHAHPAPHVGVRPAYSEERTDVVMLPTPESLRCIEQLLGSAVKRGATDLHLVAERPPLVRLAGSLVPDSDRALAPEAIAEIARHLVPDRLRARLLDEGSCDFALSHPRYGRLRANVSRQRTGYKVSLRIIPHQVPTLESYGLPQSIEKATHHHQGLIVVTGPTGHGKTSTLAAIVNLINTNTAAHIITVEDPIEYMHPRRKAMVSQREVGTHTKNFASALKGSLREDPDVIVVGELRDVETVQMAVSAAETGHLVLGTMNTPSAAKTIDRLIDMFPPKDQAQIRITLATALRLIVSQRLVPSVDGTRSHAAVELLPGSLALSALIRENKTFQIPSLQQRGKALGIIRINDSLIDLVKSGLISVETAKLATDSLSDLEIGLGIKKVAPVPPPEATAGARR